ncbi:MAG: hypothetical protein GC152_14710 [Alphaproteobacteria bacterium]|nr:hypothetical protein [Alphaproteobacteria bacterium]
MEDGVDFDPGVAADVLSDVINQAGGLIVGAHGINVDANDIARQRVRNGGVIRGNSGAAVFLGAGRDIVVVDEGGIFDGLVDLGADNDVLRIVGMQPDPIIGGATAFFDGGAGVNVLTFDSVALTDLISFATFKSGYELGWRNADASESLLRFVNFDLFDFTNGRVTFDQLVAAVPLPAAIWLFGGAIGLFAAARRGARRAA